MGQQQETVAGSSALRRLILVLTVAALMAAMMAVTATSAFAAGASRIECIEGHGTFVLTPQGKPNGGAGHCTTPPPRI